MGEGLIIRRGGGGAKVTIDGVGYKDDLSLTSKTVNMVLSPIDDGNTSAAWALLVTNSDRLYAIGSSEYLYRWTGSSWTMLDNSVAPTNLYGASLMVFNNEMHQLGNNTSIYKKSHYKWNGSSWVSVSTLPFSFNYGSAVSFNNELHILGSADDATKHYKWDGSSWTSVSTLPYSFYHGAAVVFNDEIHIFGGSSGMTKHYKWNGSSWTSVSTLPLSSYEPIPLVINNRLHLCKLHSDYPKSHYIWTGSSWKSTTEVPIINAAVVCMTTMNNEVYISTSGESVNVFAKIWVPMYKKN